jgi:hypothetical protein
LLLYDPSLKVGDLCERVQLFFVFPFLSHAHQQFKNMRLYHILLLLTTVLVFVVTSVLADQSQQQQPIKAVKLDQQQEGRKPADTNPLAGLPNEIPEEDLASLEKEKFTFQVY